MTVTSCVPLAWASSTRASVDELRREEVAAFLRARRERLSPEDVGLDRGVRRRTPGLRREELASLAGVSVTWYTWLEQARPINVSAEVIDALCRALRCDESEWRHVRRLIGLPAPVVERPDYDRKRLRSLVAALGDVPAVVMDRSLDVIGTNGIQEQIFGDPADFDPDRRNLLWWMFGETDMRRYIREWEEAADLMVAWFRAERGKYPGDQRASELIEMLSAESPEFSQRWVRAEIKQFSGRPYTVCHPRWGEFRLEVNQLHIVDQPGTLLLIFMPVDQHAYHVLKRIAASLVSLGNEELGAMVALDRDGT